MEEWSLGSLPCSDNAHLPWDGDSSRDVPPTVGGAFLHQLGKQDNTPTDMATGHADEDN